MKNLITYLLQILKSVLLQLLSSLKDITSKYFLFLLKVATVLGICYFVYGLYRDKNDAERKYNEIVGKEEQFKRINDYLASIKKEPINW